MQEPIIMYTDGAAKGNPGPGGYGLVLKWKGHRKELSGGFRKTTNNRMELLAVIVGLESIKIPNQNVLIFSDSKYVVDSVSKKWLEGWVKKGFAGKKNADLWQRYLRAAKDHKVVFRWIKGHAGHPENELCDRLAVKASEGSNLPSDIVYESGGAG